MICTITGKNLLVEREGRTESRLLVGMEYPVGTLRAVSINRRPEHLDKRAVPEPEYACPNCNGVVSKDDAECAHCHAELEEV